MRIQNFLSHRFQNKIDTDWRTVTIPKDLIEDYERLTPIIKNCYSKVAYWHGTGRYHYSITGDSKYENVNTKKIVDVLEQIIVEQGLKPHKDPWVRVNKQYSSSISTTQWRMYARTYAELHLYTGKEIVPVYGKRTDIMNFFFYYTILSTPLKAFVRSTLRAFDKKDFANKGPVWAKTINNNFQSRGNAYSDLLYILGKGSSDIKNNYGILVGIKGNKLKRAKINPIVQMFETRFIEKIKLSDISHLEVPMDNVKETQKLLSKYNIVIPILPIEVCEIYNSKQPIRYNNSNTLPSFTREEYFQHYYWN